MSNSLILFYTDTRTMPLSKEARPEKFIMAASKRGPIVSNLVTAAHPWGLVCYSEPSVFFIKTSIGV